MINRKTLVIAVLLVSCIVAMLFLVKPITSQTAPNYDPTLDVNHDGKIDIRDVHAVAMAYGSSGTPIKRAPAAQIENLTAQVRNLQNEVSILEEQSKYVKTIRYYDPAEYNESAGVLTDTKTFTWTPNDPTNNAIISIYFYYQFKVAPVNPGGTVYAIFNPGISGGYTNTDYEFQTAQTTVSKVNQAQYSLFFQFSFDPYGGGTEGTCNGTIFVTNINIVITVIDGLPPS